MVVWSVSKPSRAAATENWDTEDDQTMIALTAYHLNNNNSYLGGLLRLHLHEYLSSDDCDAPPATTSEIARFDSRPREREWDVACSTQFSNSFSSGSETYKHSLVPLTRSSASR